MKGLGRLVAVGGLLLASTLAPIGSARSATSAFTKTETITRTHLVNGADSVVDTRNVSATVSVTTSLRDRQAVTVNWTGAHPTAGWVADHNSAAAAKQEYPFVIMQCRGTDSTTVPVAQQVTPETCWTQTPGERFQYSQTGTIFPAYRMDRYATSTDRGLVVNRPNPLPSACSPVTAEHWIPFVAANGTVYPGGNLGCAGLPPEAANATDSLQPGNTTYGVTDLDGTGSARFVMQSDLSNASLACSATVACTLELIPIMGVSCDAAGTASAPGGMAVVDRPAPASVVNTVFQDCSQTGKLTVGDYNLGGADPALAVSGQLWWSASNWKNRIAVPLTFAPSSSVCDVVTSATTAYVYGSEAMGQATQQWAPTFCLDPKLFVLRHVQTSEPQAKNLLSIGNIEAAIQAGPPDTPFQSPIVQAPVAVTGFAIAYSIDGADGNTYPDLKLNARLVAKLLSESYRSCPDCLDFTSDDAKTSGFAALANNPIDMSRDPEFKALNPGIPVTNFFPSAASLAAMSSDSDVMKALTSYLNEDPEARAWLNGAPDPWGMVVNPAYKGIALPTNNWPLLDAHIAVLGSGANLCLTDNPAPWLPLIASPVSVPSTVALNLQFDISNSQISCQNNGQQNQKLVAVGREPAGARFILGLVALADAERYQLNIAQLQTQRASSGNSTFTSAVGRTFAGATDTALKAAAALLQADDTVGTWLVPYHALRTDSAGAGAYPGLLVISIDVPTTGIPAADANDYAELLRFAVGAGQTAGLGNGQLPPGYLPMTSANGLSALATYTSTAADAVAAQTGVVPFVSGKLPVVTPAPSVSSGVDSSSTAVGPVLPAPAGPTPDSDSSSAQPSPQASNSPSPSPSASSSSVRAARAGETASLTSGSLGLALPVLALVAIVAGAASALSLGGRRHQ